MPRDSALADRPFPYLVPLLKDENIAIRYLFAFILRDIKGLKEKDLDALLWNPNAPGNGWIAPAIAQIGTPKGNRFSCR